MATHRPHDTGFAPEFEFQVAMDVLDASQDLAARHLPVTPRALARRLSARPSGPRPTLAQIRDALARVRLWRDQILARDLLQHRRQLVELLARTEAERRRLDEDAAYLTVMLRETDAILRGALTAPDGAETAARPGARRALQ
ncbi:MAG: hypothetical protein V9G18_00730 [Albidovulum sp.]